MRNIVRCRPVFLLFILLSVFGTRNLRGQESEPRTVVSAFQGELLATMKHAKALGFEGRYQQLLPAMELAFDFDQIARIAVGRGWVKMTQTDQKQVVDLFRRFSVSTYASAFSDYGGEQFEISGARVQPDIGTIVETRLVLKNEAPVDLNYLLRETPAGWKIVDVYLAGRQRAGVGAIRQYHRRQGVDDLIAMLQVRVVRGAGR
jgi:phospholipid transport system substrate-binding protein